MGHDGGSPGDISMIRLTLPWLVFAALFIFLVGIILAWIGYAIMRRRSEKQKLLSWTRCTNCAYAFNMDATDALTRCPQCDSLNERQPLKII